MPHKPLIFEHDGRTYTCTVEAQRATPDQPRWWVAISGDPQRYAPIEASPGDTEKSVRKRVIEFYERHLWVLAQPPEGRSHFGRPGRPRKAVAEGVTEL
jgi:hypothetical protein